jgi:hypothetical protein
MNRESKLNEKLDIFARHTATLAMHALRCNVVRGCDDCERLQAEADAARADVLRAARKECDR